MTAAIPEYIRNKKIIYHPTFNLHASEDKKIRPNLPFHRQYQVLRFRFKCHLAIADQVQMPFRPLQRVQVQRPYRPFTQASSQIKL